MKRCPECMKSQSPNASPLISTPLPYLYWQRIATDLFEWKKTNFLLLVDYYSRWIEIVWLDQITSASVVNHMRAIFSRYGVPETVITDNIPQYSSEALQFATEYGFHHMTSSPHHPQSIGEAERVVQTVNNLLRKAKYPYQAMLVYRSTPLPIGVYTFRTIHVQKPLYYFANYKRTLAARSPRRFCGGGT